jgi:hypothetical protein
MKKTKINFYSFDGTCVSIENRAKTNRRFCPYLVREAFAEASVRLSEGERETSLRKELSTVIDEVSVGDRRIPASRRALACVGKSVSGALKGQESAPRRKKIKISSSDGGPTLDPKIRHTPDFLILLSGGGIQAKRGLRGKKKKISSSDRGPVSSLKIRHPCDFLSFPSEGKNPRKWCPPVEKRNFFFRRDGRFGTPKGRTPLDFCPSLVGGPDAKRRQMNERQARR